MTRISLAQRLAFDAERAEVRDGPRRYLLMRPDVLMGAFRGLPPETRAAALRAFADSVQANGAGSVRAYLAELGGDRAKLLQAMQDTSADLGWGRWRFTLAADRLLLEVVNSPFAAGFGESAHPVCAPIEGMLRTVAAVVLDAAEVEVIEQVCAAQPGQAVCRFEARIRRSAPAI